MKRKLSVLLLALPMGAQAQNLIPNPGFEGSGGIVFSLGGAAIDAPSGGPDTWRAFAIGGNSSIEVRTVPLAAGELHAGSSATNAVLLRCASMDLDQGFDGDNGRFHVLPGFDHQAEFYVKSANADGSNQVFDFGFPLFDESGVHLGAEPGGRKGITAGADWTLFKGPVFNPKRPAAQGHVSWRCVDDGGEDAILIASPSVTFAGEPVLPTDLVCPVINGDVYLSWRNHALYDSLSLLRDGVSIGTIIVDGTAYQDVAPPPGIHRYQVHATLGKTSGGSSCEAAAFMAPEPGAVVSVDLGQTDLEAGLQNTLRDGSTDGENESLLCGPEANRREVRANLGMEDPTPDAADGFFYFTVTDSAMKAQSTFRLDATVYDDPALSGTSLYLQYTKKESEGPADTAHTFFPERFPLLRPLDGSGQWVTVSWEIADAGFRSFQHGAADFRLGVTGGGRVCLDRVDLTFFPQPSGLDCRRVDEGVRLSWQNNVDDALISVFRNGGKIAELAPNINAFTDPSPVEGVNDYQVVVTLGDRTQGPSCEITVFVVPLGTRAGVDLGDADIEYGLVNSLRGDPGDGENEPSLCGPGGDQRDARSNLGRASSTEDVTDGFFYFRVTHPELKTQHRLLLEVTVHDAADRAGSGLFLQYTNADSMGPDDVANAFFPLNTPQVKTLGGSGKWVVLTWELDGARFRDYQHGAADFRLGVSDGGRLCIDKVELSFGLGPPRDPFFFRADADDNGTLQLTDAIRILDVLFLGEGTITCLDAGDADDNGALQLTDAVRILGALFLGAGSIPPPGPNSPCGIDPTPDGLRNADCVYTHCSS